MPDSVLNENYDDDEDDFLDEQPAADTERSSTGLYAAAVPVAAVFAVLEGGDNHSETGEPTMFVNADTPFDAAEVIRELQERGLVPAERVGALRTAIEALQTQAAAAPEGHAQRAFTTLANLTQEGSTVNAAQARNLVEMAIHIGQNPRLLTDLSNFTDAGRATALQETVDLTRRLAGLEALNTSGIDRPTVERLRTSLEMQLAQPGLDAGKLAEFNRVVERLTSAEFLRRPDAGARLSAFADLLSITNQNLRIPYERLLSDRISVENLRFAVDRFRETGARFGPPADTNPRLGTTREYNSSRMAMDAYNTGRGTEIFIPATNGSQADRRGIDGMRFNPETGEIHFVDWTNDMARKYAEGKAELALSPDARLVHDYANSGTRPSQAALEAFRAEVEAGLRGEGCGRNPSHAVPSTNRTTFERLPMPSFAQTPSESSAAAARRFIEAVDRARPARVNDPGSRRGWRYADPLIELMDQRARNAYGHMLGEQVLADRLARPIAQLAELQVRGRRPGDVSFDASTARVRTDAANLNEVTGRPMRYIELPIDINVEGRALPGESFNRGGRLVSVRLYEDGTIRGTLETGGESARRQNIELGHISALIPQMRTAVTAGITNGAVRDAANTVLDRLERINAGSPIDFTRDSAVVEAFGIACTQQERVMAAHRQSRNSDEIRERLRRMSIEVSDSDAARLAERLGDLRGVSNDALRRAHDVYQAELAFNIDQTRAEQIVTRAAEMQTRLTLPPQVAADAAALRELRGMSETAAVATAREMVEVRRLNAGIAFETAATIARGQVEQTRLAGGAAAEFREVLRDAIRDARPGRELADIRARLISQAETRALADGPHAGSWSTFHDALERMSDAEFRAFIGVPETGNLGQSLERVGRRNAERIGGGVTPPEVRPADKPAVTAASEARLEPGRRVTVEGVNYEVAGQSGTHTLLHQPGAPGEIAGEQITSADLSARYEEVRVRINGAEEIRYIERGHPERGLYRAQNSAGSTVIGLDPTMRVIETTRVTTTTTTIAPPLTATGGGSPPPAKPPEAKPVVERPRPELPAPLPAESLIRTELTVAPDGTIRPSDQRVGESMSLERLREQTELTTDQIRFLEEQAERLKRSTNAQERERGNELAETVRALRGEHGTEARARAHRAILENSRNEVNRRRGGGSGGAGVGVAVGLGILLTAALGWYLSEQRIPTSPLRRATLGSS